MYLKYIEYINSNYTQVISMSHSDINSHSIFILIGFMFMLELLDTIGWKFWHNLTHECTYDNTYICKITCTLQLTVSIAVKCQESAIGFYAKLMLYSQLHCATQHLLCVGEKRKSHLSERWCVNHSTLSRIGIPGGKGLQKYHKMH